MAISRIRAFSIVTYLTEKQLNQVISQYYYDVKHYVYILHNKDKNLDESLKEKHIHLVLYTYNSHTLQALRKWFAGYKDNKGLIVNTLIEEVHNRNKALLYLTHKEDKDKYQYSPKSLKGSICWYKKCLNLTAENEDNKNITALSLYQDINDGVDTETLLRRYGFTFIMQYRNIKGIILDYCSKINLNGDFKNENK